MPKYTMFDCIDDDSLQVSRTTSPPSKHEAGSESREHRKEAFSYMLTLFKGGCGEHGGRVPSLDVGGMEHLAFTLDSLYHLLQVCSHACTGSLTFACKIVFVK